MFEKNIRGSLYKNAPLRFFWALCGAIAFYMLLRYFPSVMNALRSILAILAPLIGGAILAFFLNPVVAFFDIRLFNRVKRKTLAHALSVFLTLIILLAVVVALVVLLIPQLVQSVVAFFDHINEYVESLKKTAQALLPGFVLEKAFPGLEKLLGADTDYRLLAEKALTWVREHRDGIIGASISAGNSVIQTALAFVFCLYILLDGKCLGHSTSRTAKAIMPPSRFERFVELVNRSNRIFIRFFMGNLLDALIVGVMCYVFMFVTDLPYGLLVTLVVAVTNLIPTFGPIIGAVVGGLLILLVKPVGVLWFFIYTGISQALDGNIIKPVLFGDITGLRPLWVLTAVLIGGGLFGVAGMVLGIPVTALLASIFEEHIVRLLKQRGYDENGVKPRSTLGENERTSREVNEDSNSHMQAVSK